MTATPGQVLVSDLALSSTDPGPRYGPEVFKAILEALVSLPEERLTPRQSPPDDTNLLSQFVDLRPDGVFILFDDNCGELAWHPASEIVAPGSPDPLTAPWLPFPFSAKELAGFMCGGWGEFVRERFGEWDVGPSQAELRRHFLGRRSVKAAEVLVAAFEAAREAIAKAPLLDSPSANAVTEATSQTSRSSAYRARRRAERKHARWRRAVVQHLLLPASEVPLEAFRDAGQKVTPASAIPTAGSDCDEGMAWESDEERQKRRLADLRSFNGEMVKRNSDKKWRQKKRNGALAKLVEQESSRGAPYSCEKSVRRDLEDAAAAEDDARRAGELITKLTGSRKV